jgi:sulfur carrier protein
MVPSPSMDFELNGEPEELPAPLTVDALLEQLGLAQHRVAVAINTEVVPRSHFARVRVQAGDRVEVIQAVGGG